MIIPRQMMIDYTTKELELGYLLNGSITEFNYKDKWGGVLC